MDSSSGQSNQETDTSLYNEEDSLDPRIQLELEKLNSSTDNINKLEIELDEANTTFRMLMAEASRRLKVRARKLGSCIDKARPFYEALNMSKHAQQQCQIAAVKYQRANEIHQAAKETVALAEARFLSKQHEWKFDSAWQEMLNNAILKVTEAENQKTESGREHQRKAALYQAAEQKVQMLEQKFKRSIIKSRPYFEEKYLCEGQLAAQKDTIIQIRYAVQRAKQEYSACLHRLEQISEEIHVQRQNNKLMECSLQGPREPGVGAEVSSMVNSWQELDNKKDANGMEDINLDWNLDKCDSRSLGSLSMDTSSILSDADDLDFDDDSQELEQLRQKVRDLATKPLMMESKRTEEVEGVEDRKGWESELNATVDKLDRMMLKQECEKSQQQSPV
ncbi:SH3 domain-binding protein 5 homolog isoform X2 [Rhopalosiphum maidis]|uniref:SH3 domain-binding protein 5 homolog isoform X2 n=1 Tax=Rhopalosiphum maidis TaxID=43146 RepID=UPI000F002FD6|nr:SH3 domain-binding protein 5 homolog isoform X2 [Rhopalosiphum maidis]